MRTEEAEWFGRALEHVGEGEGRTCLNLGCSIGPKPDAEMFIFSPVQAKGYHVVHTDMVDRPGVDIVGNIFEPACQDRLRALKPKIIVCTSVLEHVPRDQVSALASILQDLVADDGFLLVSVPYSYPYHADPIDTYYRPSPEELAGEFSGFATVLAEVVPSTTYSQDFAKLPLRKKLKVFARLATPFTRFDRFKTQCHRFLWLFRPYFMSCIVMRKPAPD